MDNNIKLETPFPEIQQQIEDKTIREQYQELLARERREAEAALNARLEQINSTGDIRELLGDMKLRIAYTSKFGSKRFAALSGAHIQREREQRQADERAAKMSKRTITTTAGRIRAANDTRKAAQTGR